jgi:hypothetical protein
MTASFSCESSLLVETGLDKTSQHAGRFGPLTALALSVEAAARGSAGAVQMARRATT